VVLDGYAGGRTGQAVGRRHVSVHRHRRIDPAVGSRRSVDAGAAFSSPRAAVDAATNRDDADALDYVTLAVRSYYDCGNFSLLPTGLAVLTALLDRLARAEPAATMSRFATTTFTQLDYPELAAAIRHLREVLGADGYESLAQVGAVMTPAAMATYAIDQIDEARAELE
jgi:hypothetical protein